MTFFDNEYMELTFLPEKFPDNEQTAAQFPDSWSLSDTESILGKIRTGSASSDEEKVRQTFTVEFYTENMGAVSGWIDDIETGSKLDGLYTYFDYQVLFVPDYFTCKSDKMQLSMMKIGYYPDKEAYDAQEASSVWVKLT